jgi:hypothetical protein
MSFRTAGRLRLDGNVGLIWWSRINEVVQSDMAVPLGRPFSGVSRGEMHERRL